MHTSAFVLCCLVYCILFCITVAVTKLLDNIQQSKLNFATFVIMHEMNHKEKAFFVTSISFMIENKNKNRSYSHIPLQLGNPYNNTEQNTVNGNKVQNQKCAGFSLLTKNIEVSWFKSRLA